MTIYFFEELKQVGSQLSIYISVKNQFIITYLNKKKMGERYQIVSAIDPKLAIEVNPNTQGTIIGVSDPKNLYQVFTLINDKDIKYIQTVKDYLALTSQANPQNPNVETKVIATPLEKTSQQKWMFILGTGNNFYIRNVLNGASGNVLDVKGGNPEPGMPIIEFTFHGK